MEAWASTFEETPHRGVGAQGLHQFDGSDEGDPDTLGRQFHHRGTEVTGHELEKRKCLL